MKNRSLAFQIWSVICGILLTVSILLTFLFSTTLQNFFTDEIYTNIENEQHVLTEYGFSDSPERGFGGSSGSRSTNRHVQHVLLPERGTVYQSPQILPDSFIEKVQKLGKRQDESSKRYSENVNGEHIFFVLKKSRPRTRRFCYCPMRLIHTGTICPIRCLSSCCLF